MTQRLTEENWLNHGLEVLATSGFTALKAEPLAKSLGVSRGSFYWHFKDIKDYHKKLLGLWQLRFTGGVITAVEVEKTAAEKLTALMTLAYEPNTTLESAIRNWAQNNAQAKEVLSAVDETRLAYLARLLRDAGVPPDRVTTRATFIYAAGLGVPMLSEVSDKTMTTHEIKALAAMMIG
ncbi:MAG: TetR/AcrR family transcriptional regulator [Maricaulaceae bacterium]